MLETYEQQTREGFGDDEPMGIDPGARVMLTELRELETWLAHSPVSTSPGYATACERAIEIRKRLRLPEAD